MKYDYFKLVADRERTVYLRIDENKQHILATWRDDETGSTYSLDGGMTILEGQLYLHGNASAPYSGITQTFDIGLMDAITEEEYLRALEIL